MPRKSTCYIASLVILSLSLSSCGVVVRQANQLYQQIDAGSLLHQGRIAPLTSKEITWAKTAWRYFINNTDNETGLVNALDRYPMATPWTMADSLAALLSAHQLGLIEKIEFDQRLSRLLAFMSQMDLVEGQLPNRFYQTKTGKMLNQYSEVGEAGWSALEISRLLIWLKIVGEYYPEYHEYLDKIVLRWHFCQVIDDCGQLKLKTKANNQWQYESEGRLGYQQYAGFGFSLWGFNSDKALNFNPNERIKVDNINLLYDARDPRLTNISNPILTTPYNLLGLEFAWQIFPTEAAKQQKLFIEQAQMVYRVQEKRWQTEKIFTAKADYYRLTEPRSLNDSVFANGQPWNTINDKGQWYPKLAVVSTKAAFSMWVLWKTDYTQQLMKVIEALYDKDRGWYEGRYEASGAYERQMTSYTNAMVLESLLYKAKGPIYRHVNQTRHFNQRLDKIYARPQQCFPQERPVCPL